MPSVAVHQPVSNKPLPCPRKAVLGLFRWTPCGMWASPCFAANERLAPSLILWH